MTSTRNQSSLDSDEKLQRETVICGRCPRLVDWRESIAHEKVKRFHDHTYWGKPVPSFGSIDAALLIVGLAPAAHGANRTGRMFTGDRSGDWLYDALFRFGFASQPVSKSVDDGLRLINCRITAVAHCAPPQNKLMKEEIENCRFFLSREIRMMKRLKVILTLGKIAFEEVLAHHFDIEPSHRMAFTHGTEMKTSEGLILLASYHPSQQNTFTGKLTKKMFYSIFQHVQQYLH